MSLTVHPSWKVVLDPETKKPYFAALRENIVAEYAAGKQVYPPKKCIFAALDACPLDEVKVVLLGQDPYHGPGQAHGLSFSVPSGMALPPSLRNIYKELSDDMQLPMPKSGDLTTWAQQGVLLLNASLTVRARTANSHKDFGWHMFTDEIIRQVSVQQDHVVFFLWGVFAQKKAVLIDPKKHLIFRAPHPSPLSAHRGFFGSKPFSRANAWMAEKGLSPIDWSLS